MFYCLIIDKLECIGIICTQVDCILGGKHIKVIHLLIALLLPLLVLSVQPPVASLQGKSYHMLGIVIMYSFHVQCILVSQVLMINQLLIVHAVTLLELKALVQEFQASKGQLQLLGNLVSAPLQVSI